ncbi:uncharacterized protein [Miscanthus floridulus]|uniref:uncharacterized protein n=1 Tax=Miscanthus floridulus TaxID=154761 RepID=UPI00345748ED
MAWGFIITPETFNYIISENALRCAKAVLEGKAPELSGHRANPNCMNPYGYFPLHEAAERFSVDMVKLLIKYGASANTRTAGNKIIENLLPLHVAKIFLDTTRLLAKRTNNLLDEIWNYVKDGKLVQTAVLLLAGQEQIRGVSFSKKRIGIRKQDGFDTLMTRMMKHSVALKWKIGEHRSSQNLPEACSTLDSIALLVDIISQAGEALDAYITTHSTVPHVEVFERVDSIIKDYGFFPNGEGIDVGKLCPYDCRMFTKAGEHEDLDATKVTAESAYPHGTAEKAKNDSALYNHRS